MLKTEWSCESRREGDFTFLDEEGEEGRSFEDEGFQTKGSDLTEVQKGDDARLRTKFYLEGRKGSGGRDGGEGSAPLSLPATKRVIDAGLTPHRKERSPLSELITTSRYNSPLASSMTPNETRHRAKREGRSPPTSRRMRLTTSRGKKDRREEF